MSHRHMIERKKRIMDIIGRKRFLSRTQIARELGIDESSAYRAINQLLDEGKLKKVPVLTQMNRNALCNMKYNRDVHYVEELEDE